MVIRAPKTAHSLNAIFPVSPSPTGHSEKEQSGTHFGKRGALEGSCRDRRRRSCYGFPIAKGLAVGHTASFSHSSPCFDWHCRGRATQPLLYRCESATICRSITEGDEFLRINVLASLVALSSAASLQAQAPVRQATSPGNPSVSHFEHTVNILPVQQSAPTPFFIFNGIILLEVKINGRSGWAMLDNGFAHIVIDLGFANTAGLKIGPVINNIDLGPVSAPERLIEGMRIDVPGQLILSGAAMSVDLKAFSNTVGHPIDAVIGGDYLDKLCVLVAPSNKTLIFAKTGDITPKGRAVIIPLKNGAQLTAEVNGQPVVLAIDLGFNGVVQLKEEAWKRVIPSRSPTKEGMISSADGVLRPSRSVQNATLKVGQISADGVGVAVGDRIATGADGLLGTGFLGKFDFILDVGASRLVAIPFG